MTFDGQLVEISCLEGGAYVWRRVVPVTFFVGTVPGLADCEPQWLMIAFDCERGEDRTFALADVHGWRRPE